MKTFLKMIIAVAAFGFATSHAALRPDQSAAIAAVVAAVESEDEEAVTAAVSAQVAAFPEIAGLIVAAGLKVSGISIGMQTIIVRIAAWTAPGEIASIIVGIESSGLGESRIAVLKTIARRVATAADNAGGAKETLPPITVS